MAVVKANFVKRGRTAKARAKATIRYLLHRPGKDGHTRTRTLFGADGVITKQQAYHMIDAAKQDTIFFRIIISPDPAREDRGRDLALPEITSHTLLRLEARLHKPVHFIAAEHDDHTPNRHVHALVLIQGKLTREDVQALRQAATELAHFQRRERDLAREPQQQEAAQGRRISRMAHPRPREPHAKPLPTTRPCYRCGEEQPVSWTEEHRCSSCGATLSRYGPGYKEKGAHWG